MDTDRVEVLAASGVVYEIHVPLTVFHRLPAVGGDVELRTAYIVRDDTPSLFGFLSPRECALFHRLLSVQKIGPRLAVALMGTYRAGRLARGIVEGDVKLLSLVPGVGRKTAERIVLELSDKLRDLAAARESGPDARAAADAVSALMGLGYSSIDADAAVRRALKEASGNAPPDAEVLVRRVLAQRDQGRGAS